MKAMAEHPQLLTHSRQDTFKTCRKRHWFAYELGIRPIHDARAIRMGSAGHAGIEALGNGLDIDAAVEVADLYYQAIPEFAEPLEWDYERETVIRLLCGYAWRWQDDGLQYVKTEFPFELPLNNSATGRPTPNFRLAGKTDGIVRLADGRLAVKETKFQSEDLNDASDLWRRLQIDHQISLYVLAARKKGYQVESVLYDAIRKPTIRPTPVPLLDELGAKVVLDEYGIRVRTERGQWRQTGDKEKGWLLQQRPMTAAEWGDKLNEDIAARPDWYYARREIARLDADLEEYETELWDIQKAMRDAQLNDRHYRTCNKETCAWCPYFGPCSARFDMSGAVPDGFVRVSNIHPELGDRNVNRPSEAAGATTSGEATAAAGSRNDSIDS